jgi:hypothetical protein
VIAAYAALFEPCIEQVALIEPPASHRTGPMFLNVLRVLDVPDALGLLAPRRLTLVTTAPDAFARARAAFTAAGHADRLSLGRPAAP